MLDVDEQILEVLKEKHPEPKGIQAGSEIQGPLNKKSVEDFLAYLGEIPIFNSIFGV